MRPHPGVAAALALCLATGCSAGGERPAATGAGAAAGIDSLNARVVQAYRASDPKLYAAQFTDTAMFEWPAFNTVRGRAGLESLARGNWASLADMDLKLVVASRRLAPDHATEHGAFEQSWRDKSGTRMTEYGRYVHVLARQGTEWRIDRFFGFSDSTRPLPPAP
jgi:ketosteroid isomerase-like protein